VRRLIVSAHVCSFVAPFLISFLVSFFGGAREARACPPTVLLGGDKTLVSAVAPLLAGRGISTEEGGCPGLAVTLEKRGRATLVFADAVEEQASPREVTDARTAATVIESWVRTDVDAPLLARHPPVDDLEVPVGLVVAAPQAASRPFEVATLGELGVASDRTTLGGFQVSACGMVGRVCVGGRARFGTVIDGPGAWEGPMDREVVDGLVDAELPLRLGPVALSPGLGVGLGWVHTHEEDSRDAKQTAGLRGELHLALVVPLTQHVAFESTLSLELANTLVTERASRERLPDDPKALAHAGLGLRFEAP
jgi:hypothetical protein